MIEYHIEHTNGYPIPVERLNQLGAEGWQLIQVIADVGYFSRPAQPKPKTTRKRKTTKAK
jgi:hypothetical protein